MVSPQVPQVWVRIGPRVVVSLIAAKQRAWTRAGIRGCAVSAQVLLRCDWVREMKELTTFFEKIILCYVILFYLCWAGSAHSLGHPAARWSLTAEQREEWGVWGGGKEGGFTPFRSTTKAEVWFSKGVEAWVPYGRAQEDPGPQWSGAAEERCLLSWARQGLPGSCLGWGGFCPPGLLPWWWVRAERWYPQLA